MYVDIISDLHVEFWREKLYRLVPFGNSDTLICAGDLGEFRRPGSEEALKTICEKYEQVFYVPGNHDYYGSSIEDIEKKFTEITQQISNLTILRTGVIGHLSDFKVIGDTLWIPDHPQLMRYQINDSRMIQGLTPFIFEQHQAFKEFAMANADEKTIVVTHHLPSNSSVSLRFIMEPTTRWFVGDCTDVITERKPAIWIHGHTHDPFDYRLENTRVICNPFGYPAESNGRRRNITYNIG